MNYNHQYDVAIVGGGPIGMYASCVTSMLGLQTCIIEKSNMLGGQCMHLYPEKPIFDIPGYPEIKAEKLIHNLQLQMNKFHIDTYLDTAINKISKDDINFSIECTPYNIQSRAVILAIGEGSIQPRKLDLPNILELENKGYIRYTMHNIEMFKYKSVAIAGGGDAAADWIMTLSNIASHISMFHRRAKMRCMDSLQHELNQLQSNNQLDMYLNTSIVAIEEVNHKIQISYHLNDVNDFTESHIMVQTYDYLVVCYGSSAEKTIIDTFTDDASPQMTNNDEIIIDPYTASTSVENLYAIGDCTGYVSHIRPKIIALGFGEANSAGYHIRKHVFSHKAYKFTHSTSL